MLLCFLLSDMIAGAVAGMNLLNEWNAVVEVRFIHPTREDLKTIQGLKNSDWGSWK